MKKTLSTLSLLLAGWLSTQAQPYGQFSFPYPGALLSSAKVTTMPGTEGHLMTGYYPIQTPSGFNFCINKTDVNGNFGTGTIPIKKDYAMQTLSACQQGLWTLINNCEGVTAIETKNVTINGTANYVVAGTYDEGVFIATLDINGAQVLANSFKFPSPKVGVGKPYLLESSITTNEYFICGKYDRGFYLIKVDASLNLIWQKTYGIAGGTGSLLEPRSMIECPFTKDVTIVGRSIDPNIGTGVDGFLLRIAQSNGNNTLFLCYDQIEPNCTNDQYFSDVKPVFGKHNVRGYVISGWDACNPIGNIWVTRVDLNGNKKWSRNFGPFSSINPISVPAITARVNTSNKNEFYVTAHSTSAGMQVLKIDDNGHLINGPSFNEFVYNAPLTSNSSAPVNIDFQDNPSFPNNIALCVYGNADPVNGGAFYVVRAYFNGYSSTPTPSGCLENLYNANQKKSSVYINVPTLGTGPALMPCAFNLHWVDRVVNPVAHCIQPSLPLGDNSRIAMQNENPEPEVTSIVTQAMPNPTNDKSTISFSLTSNSNIKINVFDYSGKLIMILADRSFEPGEYRQEIDFKSCKIESGIYIVTISADGEIHSSRLIYNKE